MMGRAYRLLRRTTSKSEQVKPWLESATMTTLAKLTAAPALTVRIEQLVAKLSSGVPGWPVKLATGINNPSIVGAGYIDPSSEGVVEETVPPAPADPDLQQPDPVATPAVAVISTTVGSVTQCLHFPKRVLRYSALRHGSPCHSEQH